jgi:hypothetical protein
VPAEQLERDGYVVAASADSLDYHYYGPDAEVLLGDVFVATHCFSARDGGPEHPGLVGLAFEPAPKRRLPDVTGVLWLERRSLELRFLDFSYTGLWTKDLGGRVEFARLASGPWIVAYWWIRTPRPDTAQRYVFRPHVFRPREQRALGYRESGGLVTTVESARGRVEHAGLEAVLRGTVLDSTRGGIPLSGATLWLAGDWRTPTDQAGRFEIRGPFDGEYRLSFWHPRLDSLGINADEQPVTLTRGSAQSLTLSVPPERVVVRRLCPHGLAPGGHVLVGWVRDSTLAPVPRAQVQVRPAGSVSRQTGTASRDGQFIICNALPGAVFVSAEGRGLSGTVAILFWEGQVWVDGHLATWEAGRVWRQDILVKPRQ